MATPDGTGPEEPYFRITPEAADQGFPEGASIRHLDDLPSYEVATGLYFRPVFAENLSLNFVTFPAHSGFPAHTHSEEQVSIVHEGSMEIIIEGQARMVGPGDVIVFPSGVPHAGRTLGDACRLIDVFSPPRTGIRDVIAGADPARSADVDRWWAPTEDARPPS